MCTLRLGDRTLTMLVEAHPFSAGPLASPGPTCAAAVGGLHDASTRVVVQRLVLEGVITPAEDQPGEGADDRVGARR